jgi:hypothetical protein
MARISLFGPGAEVAISVERTDRDLALGNSLIFNLPVLYQHQDALACRISID